MTEVRGTWDNRFEGVRDALANLIDSGQDVGCSACVAVEGEVVADVWGGWMDEDETRPWERDTIVNVWSTTKTMTALAALMLVDRGELDVDAPVATYWPEFAQNGKDGVLVRHLMSHTAGLPGFDPSLSNEELFDWDTTCANLAAQSPWWEPGSASGYHAITQGQLVGEVVRRVTGVSLGTFFAKEIAGPLDADFHIGTEPVHFDRISNVIAPPGRSVADGMDPDDEIQRKMIASTPDVTAQTAWTEAFRRAELPAANGHGNARSVARIQAAVSNGGVSGGVRLLSRSPEDVIFREQCNGTDLMFRMPLRHGIGYGLPNEMIPFPSPRTCFWGGWGGSLVINDFENKMTVAYVMNKMGEGTTGDARGATIIAAAYGALFS
ncbi:MAG TPA: serine hydrolase domain-containing protein [Acidimicrobiales bacterium]|nr:serine hydrolase domain-containing protein [Acidimicrobiales bacterium]